MSTNDIHNPRVTGNARVTDTAQVTDNARVTGTALVTGNALVTDTALVTGNARVTDTAQVTGNARVTGTAQVTGRGDISSTHHFLTVGPMGSEDRYVTVHRHYGGPDSQVWGHLVVAGCWRGTLDELDARIHSGDEHGWDYDEADRSRADYEALITYARHRVVEWEAEPLTQADHDRWAR